MAATLLEFGWALRRHAEAGVRRAVLRATAVCTIREGSTPSMVQPAFMM